MKYKKKIIFIVIIVLIVILTTTCSDKNTIFSPVAGKISPITGEHEGFLYIPYNNNSLAIYGYKGSKVVIEIPAEIKKNKVEVIESRAFYEKGNISVNIGKNVKKIHYNAFINNPLTSIRIGDNVVVNNSFPSDFSSVYNGVGGHFTRESADSNTWTRMP